MKIKQHNNKHSIASTLSLLCLSLVMASCNEWLDIQPRSQVEDTELFSSERGFKEALAGVYSSMLSNNTYAKELTYGFIGVLGQEWDYYYSSQYSDAATYNYDAAYPTGFIRGIWTTNYTGIANANHLLANIDAKAGLFAKDNYEVIKGEALALRAFLHFDLLRCFGVSYAVNPNQPSIPYSSSLSYGVAPQLSVSEATEAVLKDVLDAEVLLKGHDPIATGRTITEVEDNGYLYNRQLHLNYYAVKGLEARVRMWKGDYEGASKAADEVMQSGAFTWATVGNLQAGYDRCLADEHLFALNNLTLTSDVADAYFSDSSPYSFAVTRERLLDYFDNATQDYRYTFLFKSGSSTHANNRYVTKYDEPSNGAEFYSNKMPLIRLAEIYLIKCETLYRLGNTDEALAVLNQVRNARNLPALGEMPADFFTELLHEYRRELLGEGQLFFLYKRLNSPVILYSDADAVADKVYTFPLPITETESAHREENR